MFLHKTVLLSISVFSILFGSKCLSQESENTSHIQITGENASLESIEYIGEKNNIPVFKGNNNKVYLLKNETLKAFEGHFRGTPLYINNGCYVCSEKRALLRIKAKKRVYKVSLDDGLYYDYPLYANKNCDSIFYSDSFGNIRLVRFNGQKFQTLTLFEGISPFLTNGFLYFARYKNKSSPAPDVELYKYDFSEQKKKLLIEQTHPASVFVMSEDLIFCAILKDGDYKDVIFNRNKGESTFTGKRYFIKGYYPFQYKKGKKILFYHPSEFKIKALKLSN